MKSRSENNISTVVFAALTIIGCSISSMCSCHQRRGHQQRVLEDAMQTWEAEGGAVVLEDDEEEVPVRA